MICKLSPNLLSDEYNYYFSILTDRFQPINQLWIEQLEQKFNKKFKPIFILPFKHNKIFEEENYIVLNEDLFKLQKKLKKKNVINLIYPEDLNKQFSQSKFIKGLIRKLIKKQGRVFIVDFTSVWLDIKDPNVIILGPDPDIAAKLDNKTEHIKIFKKLKLKTNKTNVFKNIDQLRRGKIKYPVFISAAYSSGGIESRTLYTADDLAQFYFGLRPVNRSDGFIVADLLDDIVLAPNVSAIVTGKDQTKIICLSDQILRDNRYMGNIYPSKVSSKHKKEIIDATVKVGNYISQLGFKGLFGMDFLITKKGNCYPTDLNPRRQGGYFCNVAMSQKINIVELEFKLALGEKLPEFDYSDFHVDYCWAHTKLSPYFPNIEILREFQRGDIFGPFKRVGSTYAAIYYPEKHILMMGNPGFYLISGENYDDVKYRLLKESEQIISKNYSTYEGL